MQPLILLGLALGVYVFVAALFEEHVPGAYMVSRLCAFALHSAK